MWFSPEKLLQTCGFSELLKELLVEDEGDTTNLLDLCLCCCVPVDEVSRDGDGELSPELFTPKPCELQKEVTQSARSRSRIGMQRTGR